MSGNNNSGKTIMIDGWIPVRIPESDIELIIDWDDYDSSSTTKTEES